MINPFEKFDYKGLKKSDCFYPLSGLPKSKYRAYLKSIDVHIENIIEIMGSVKVIDLSSVVEMRLYMDNFEYLVQSKAMVNRHIQGIENKESNGWSSKND